MEVDSRPVVAAFDFDGTLTYYDSLLFFFLYVVGPFKTLFYLLLQLPTLTLFAFGRKTRLETKEAILTQFLKGVPMEELREKGEAFAKEGLSRHLRPGALPRLKWHKKQGHRCVLVSASLDVYLEPWAKLVGFDDALTTRLAIDKEGKVTGKLFGPNCRAAEKVSRLIQLIGPLEKCRLYAYGDSRGDKELLEAADDPFYRKMPGEKS